MRNTRSIHGEILSSARDPVGVGHRHPHPSRVRSPADDARQSRQVRGRDHAIDVIVMIDASTTGAKSKGVHESLFRARIAERKHAFGLTTAVLAIRSEERRVGTE